MACRDDPDFVFRSVALNGLEDKYKENKQLYNPDLPFFVLNKQEKQLKEGNVQDHVTDK